MIVVVFVVEEKRGLGKRLVHWWRRMWGTAEPPPLTSPLVNTMDHTLFDYIYHTEAVSKPSIPEGVLELQQVPATNLTPPEKETDPTSIEPPKTPPKNTTPAEPVLPEKVDTPQQTVAEPEEYDDDIDDVRIIPTEDK